MRSLSHPVDTLSVLRGLLQGVTSDLCQYPLSLACYHGDAGPANLVGLDFRLDAGQKKALQPTHVIPTFDAATPAEACTVIKKETPTTNKALHSVFRLCDPRRSSPPDCWRFGEHLLPPQPSLAARAQQHCAVPIKLVEHSHAILNCRNHSRLKTYLLLPQLSLAACAQQLHAVPIKLL
eukprot:780008-Pelagomonas_calceolata.AAC.3